MKSKTIFKNYREYHSLTRTLSTFQKEVLFCSLPVREQLQLSRSFKRDGWEDLFIANEVDDLLDQVKDEFDVDLIFLRIRVLSGDVQKIQRQFWVYVQELFRCYAMRHIWHIFEGIKTMDLNKDYVLLVPSKRRTNGKEGLEG